MRNSPLTWSGTAMERELRLRYGAAILKSSAVIRKTLWEVYPAIPTIGAQRGETRSCQ
ncbi:hypothetical protein [Ferrimicrobium sp.]|uniref:hypothetical protein n=1 Tax=Ferrimicrobium sp. TaxID=2926050 RepID=UPI00261F505D|nr:hypothetical protein [Ferrimicrobium sp.]